MAQKNPFFKPTLDENTTKELFEQYSQQPDKFDWETSELLRKHASHYELGSPDIASGNSIYDSLAHIGKGWLHGMTTIDIDHGDPTDYPKTSTERIARSLGHLAGFVGYFPGAGKLSGPLFKLLGLSKLSAAARMMRGKSVPLMAGQAITGAAKRTAIGLSKKGMDSRAGVTRGVAQFLNNTKTGDMLEGAMELGIASGLSSWQQGIGAVADGMFGGAVAGAGFRAIGNLIQLPGAKPALPGTPFRDLSRPQINEKLLRTIAGSLMLGLPATARGATTEEQIYDYLLGGYFGKNEMPGMQRRGLKHLKKMDEHEGGKGTFVPEEVDGWKDISKESKEYVKEYVEEDIKLGGRMSSRVVKKYQDLDKKAQEARERGQDIYENEIIEKVELPKEARDPSENETISTERDNTDMETPPTEALFGKTKYYVKRYLEPYWKDADNPQSAFDLQWIEVNRQWNKQVSKARENEALDNQIHNPARMRAGMIEWLNKKYERGITEGSDEWNFWVKWGNSRIHNVPTRMGSINIGKGDTVDSVNLLDSERPFNQAGNLKHITEPPKSYDVEYINAYERINGVPPEKGDNAYVVFDHILSGTETGGRYQKEYTFNTWKASLERSAKDDILQSQPDLAGDILEQRISGEVDARFNDALSKVVKEMDKKGYYYGGGKGDAGRLYFVKKHPELVSAKQENPDTFSSNVRGNVNNIAESFEKTIPGSKKNIDKERELFNKWMGLNKDDPTFDSMYMNNWLYDAGINGIDVGFENVRFLADSSWVDTALKYNKRAQIWLTNGSPSNENYVRSRLESEHSLTIDDEGFRAVFVRDADHRYPQDKLNETSKAGEYVHTSDGEIIALPEIVEAQNRDWGLPVDGGVQKSFIVSPHDSLGAILGKYQVKGAHPELAEQMRQKDIDMFVSQSSAKQSGIRNYSDWRMDRAGQLIIEPESGFEEVYHIPIQDFKAVTSEITDKKFTQPKRFVKQLQSNLTPFGFKPIKQEVIDDIFESVSARSFIGEDAMNDNAIKLFESPRDTTLENTIVNNLESLGIDNLITLMKSPKHESFAIKAYQKILSLNDEFVRELEAEGEVSKNEALSMKLDATDWSTIFERMVKINPNSIMPLLHNVGTAYRQTAIRNYIMAQITKPKVKNSIVTRMTGWDKFMRTIKNNKTDLKRFNRKSGDDYFFLDDGFKETKIHLWNGQVRTLEEVWNDWSSPTALDRTTRAKYSQVLHALAVRVPMDSLSGAHSLKFGGFTGRAGLGSVLHPRTMEALGGADLDADKAYFYFGDEAHGMKQAWREAYHNQRKEFYDADGKIEPAKKLPDPLTGKPYADAFRITDKNLINRLKDPALMYSPLARLQASKGAWEGRALLGPAVVGRATTLQAYNHLRSVLETGHSYNLKLGRQILEIIPKTDKESLDRFRGMAKASVAVTSDPMDEAGLVGMDKFFTNVVDTLFDMKLHGSTKGRDWVIDDMSKLRSDTKRKGVIGIMQSLNSASYGRNRLKGRAYTQHEFRDRMNRADALPSDAEGRKDFTLYSKIAELTKHLDWTDSMVQRVDPRLVQGWYDNYNSEKNSPEYQVMKDALGRAGKGFTVGIQRPLETVIKFELFDYDKRQEAWTDSDVFGQIMSRKGLYKLYVDDMVKYAADNGIIIDYGESVNKKYERAIRTLTGTQRREIIDDLIRKGQDFIVNDIQDVASIKLIKEYFDKGFEPAGLKRLSELADQRSHAYREMAMERRKPTELSDPEATKEEREFILEAEKEISRKGVSAEMDQRVIDEMIREDKRDMTGLQSDLYDSLLLSSWHRGNREFIGSLRKGIRKLERGGINPWYARNYLKQKEAEFAKTSFNRVGFASKEVGDHVILRQMDIMEEELNSMRPRVEEAPNADSVKADLDAESAQRPLFDADGKRLTGLPYEVRDLDAKTGKYLNDYAPFEGLKTGKLNPKMTRVYNRIIENMEFYGPKVGKNIHLIVRNIVNKDINAMNARDWIIVDNYLQDFRDGSWFQKTFSKSTEGFPKIKKWFYYMFPRAIGRNIMKYEINLHDRMELYKDKFGNVINGKTKEMTNTMSEIQNDTHLGTELATMARQKYERGFDDKLKPYLSSKFGTDIYEFAMDEMEFKTTGRDLRKEGREQESLVYEKRYREKAKKIKWTETRDNDITITGEGGPRILTGRELVNEIQKIVGAENVANRQRLVGDKEWFLNEFALRKKDGNVEYILAFDKDGKRYETNIPLINEKKYMKFLTDHYQSGKQLPLDKIGIDGNRKAILSLQFQQTRRSEKEADKRDAAPVRYAKKGFMSDRISRIKIDDTGQLGDSKGYGYVPHVTKMFDRDVASKDLKAKIRRIWDRTDLDTEAKKERVVKLYMQTKTLTGDYTEMDIQNDAWDVVTEAIIARHQKKDVNTHIKWFEQNQRIGNQFSRANHVDGWMVTPEAYTEYANSIYKTFYRQVSQIMARHHIEQFYHNHPEMPEDLKLNWMNFFKLYAQQSMGFPSVIPDHFYTKPEHAGLNLKGTLFSALADNRVAKRIDTVAKRLGLTGKELPAELKDIDSISVNDVIRWGNAEAKYALTTLLAHPKTSITNIFGGSALNVINAGWGNFRKARNIEFLRQNIDTNFKTMDDVNRWVRELGIIEEFILREANLDPRFTGKRWQEFTKDFRKAISSDPDFSDINLKTLFKKHKLSEQLVTAAGKFMSLPERILRRDAFISHYVQAKEKFGGAVTQRDHPFLIEMGKKGVRLTQFLYSAPFRPMFAATAFGKVFSRFQLWAWNSVRFRNEVVREAAIRGITEGTPEFQRLKRLVIADSFALALGGMFMYSLFDAGMPQPYSWFQDAANWLMGEEKERDRAFFGAYPTKLAPLQLITPPSFRLTGPILNGLINDDWEKLGNYYSWTMFPFGRIARDIIGPGGLVDNPYYAIDKITGLPLVSAKRIMEKRKKADAEEESKFYAPPVLGSENWLGT